MRIVRPSLAGARLELADKRHRNAAARNEGNGMEKDMDNMEIHESYMKRAVRLAMKGRGYTSPNPMVGCVVVKDGRMISEGYHEKYGQFHAERNALLRCKEDASGADLYVTLEPCCHYGKTPPCTEIIIEKKIGRVFVGSMDPNPLVAGQGVKILQDAGIEVVTGILEEECLKMNEIFFHFITTKTPFVISKFAMTLDGKIACESGDSKWVSSEESRKEVHLLRKYCSGIMAGIGTVLADDPMLNCRVEKGVDPIRIICDSHLRIPLESKIVQTAREIPTIVAAAAKENPAGPADRPENKQNCSASEGGKNIHLQSSNIVTQEEKEAALRDLGVEVIRTSAPDQVDLRELIEILGKRGIDSILLEGGGELNAAAFQAGIVQKVQAYIAGKIVGGAGAKTPVSGKGIQKMKDAIELENLETEIVGGDIRVTGYPKPVN